MRNPIETTRFANTSSPPCSREVDQANGEMAPTKLLISVRNADEATMVLEQGADWIDLKEPLAGSLGRPRLAEAVAVAKALKGHSMRSVALGELNDLDEQIAFQFAELFPVLKVGLSRVSANSTGGNQNWQNRFESLSTQLRERGSELIPVAYADASICGAPCLEDVQKIARKVNATHMLIDTFVKDGSGLMDWLSLSDLQRVIEANRQFHCGTVLAGSLKLVDVSTLLPLVPAALAVRGAVCLGVTNSSSSDYQDRTTPIDPTRVAVWRKRISNSEPC